MSRVFHSPLSSHFSHFSSKKTPHLPVSIASSTPIHATTLLSTKKCPISPLLVAEFSTCTTNAGNHIGNGMFFNSRLFRRQMNGFLPYSNNNNTRVQYSTSSEESQSSPSSALYLEYLSHTLELISTHLEPLMDLDDAKITDLHDPDPSVLEIETDTGIFVISRQRANQELWYSSPITGPWHYRMVTIGEDRYKWECTREGEEDFWDLFTREMKEASGVEDLEFGEVDRLE